MSKNNETTFLKQEIEYWKNEAQQKQNEIDILKGNAIWK